MVINSELKESILELAKQQIILVNKGGPFEDGKLFEQILLTQAFILKNFGLPNTSENERLLFFKTLPSDKEIDEKISELHKAATEYLLSIGESDVIFLKNAQELNLSAFAALPELKIITHAYTCFVYDNILLEKKDTIENVLDDLKFVNNPQTLNIIGKINADNYKEKNILLESFKIKYINQYINQHFNL